MSTLPPDGKVDPAFTYVALSRVKQLDDLLILRDFDKSLLNPKYSDDFIIEQQRIIEMDKLN
jgi:hypothetical protein